MRIYFWNFLRNYGLSNRNISLGGIVCFIAHLDRPLNAVANDHQHVAIFGHFEFVTDVAVTWNDHRPEIFVMLIQRTVQDKVERLDFALNASAPRQIDVWIMLVVEDIAGGDYIGLAEMNDHVTVGRCVRRTLRQGRSGDDADVVVIRIARLSHRNSPSGTRERVARR